MGISIGTDSTGALPFQITTTGQQQEQSTNMAQSTAMDQYTPQQQALQSQGLSGLAGVMAGGSVPANFGLPQSVYDAAFANFNQYQVPQLAAQHGAGSPVINSAAQNLQVQLAGLSGQQAMSNFKGIYDTGLQYAFRPAGTNSNTTLANTFDRTFNQAETGIDYGNYLGGVAQMSYLAPTFP